MLTATAIVLAAAGVFAGIKKSVPAKIYYKSSGGTCISLLASNVPAHFTNAAATFQAAIRSGGGTNLLLWSTATCTTGKAYFKN